MPAVRLGIHDVAANEMCLVGVASPLKVEEVIPTVRKRPQQDHVAIHPKSAVFVEYRVAEDVAEISNLGLIDDTLEETLRNDVVGAAQFDVGRSQELELFRRIAPHLDRMTCRAH